VFDVFQSHNLRGLSGGERDKEGSLTAVVTYVMLYHL
jgi:hypothetical protein